MSNRLIYIKSPFTPHPCVPTLSNGIIAGYVFDESAGDLIDVIGSNDLTVGSAIIRGESGVFGSSYKFPASGDSYLEGLKPHYLNTKFTIGVIFKSPDYHAGDFFSLQSAVASNQFTERQSIDWLQQSMNVLVKFVATGGGSGTLTDVILDQWQCATYVYDRSGLTMGGGISLDDYTRPVSILHTQDISALTYKTDWRIGMKETKSTSEAFKGNISQIVVWDRLLTECEQIAYYNYGTFINVLNL